MILLLVPISVFVIITIINGFLGPYLKKINVHCPSSSRVSILIPAKNERERIDKCIETMLEQDYPEYEILVLDDESTDGTFEHLESKYKDRIQVLRGRKRPLGWAGKNWACKQLADASIGRYLIFTDADNWYSREAISKTISAFKSYKLDMLSCFPESKMKSFHEKIYSGVVEHILYSLLPLWMTLKSKQSSLAAANGQWIAFKRESYFEIGGHEVVKSTNVEDIALARLTKKKQMRLLTLAGIGVVFTRMYTNYNEISKGFSKNMYQMLGGNLLAFIFNVLMFWSTLIALFAPNPAIVVSSFILLISWKVILSYKYKLNFLMTLIFHPFILIFITFIGVKSIFNQGKMVSWR